MENIYFTNNINYNIIKNPKQWNKLYLSKYLRIIEIYLSKKFIEK